MMGRHVILSALLLVLVLPSVHAAAIGVNKAVMDFDGVLRSGYAQDTVWVSTDTPEPVDAFIVAEGETASWFRFIPNTTNVSAGQGAMFTVIVEPPDDTPTGTYEVTIRVGTGALGAPEGQYGSTIRAGFRIKTTTVVTSEQRLTCDAGGFAIADTEEGLPLRFSYIVGNTGNVRVQPRFSYDIWDKYQEVLVASGSLQASRQTLPTVTDLFESDVPETALQPGQYWMDISSEPCGESSLITFSIVERGQISDKGDLLRIDAPTWVNVGDIVPITAVFRNRGVRTVAAVFNGQVLLDDRLVGLVESETLNVEPGETIELPAFFTPRSPGQFIIKGRVTYNQKVTFEKRSLFNARATEEYLEGLNVKRILLIGASAIVIVLIAVFLMLITHRKRRRRRF